ncbi:MAG: MFS transporter [Candidatus Korobacteraceae bacterium]|jgi:MFS family permease
MAESGRASVPASDSAAGIKTLVLLTFATTAGVMVEFYDFFLYGYAAATVFPKLFFPNLPADQALVLSYLAFGAGFPARILGAFLFGHFGDRIGRKFSFVTNILVTGIATFAVALVPGYARIGIAAPIIVMLLRMVQGIGVGGEFGGASSLMAEFSAKRKHRTFWIGMTNMGMPLGSILASCAMLAFGNTFMGIGWRISMMLSAVVVIPALLARYKLAESPLFDKLNQTQRAKMPSFAVFKRYSRPVFLLALITAFQHMDSYVSGTYIIAFMRLAGLPLTITALAITLGRVADVAGMLAASPLTEWAKKRKSMAYIAIGITTLLSFPYVGAILGKNIPLVMVFQFLISLFGLGLMHGILPVLTTESFPTKYRYSGGGIAYSFSSVMGGMVAPSMLAALIGTNLGKWYYLPAVYLVYCAIAMTALIMLRETQGVELEDVDRQEGTLEAKAVKSLAATAGK